MLWGTQGSLSCLKLKKLKQVHSPFIIWPLSLYSLHGHENMFCSKSLSSHFMEKWLIVYASCRSVHLQKRLSKHNKKRACMCAWDLSSHAWIPSRLPLLSSEAGMSYTFDPWFFRWKLWSVACAAFDTFEQVCSDTCMHTKTKKQIFNAHHT